jgi:hypothetical protein
MSCKLCSGKCFPCAGDSRQNTGQYKWCGSFHFLLYIRGLPSFWLYYSTGQWKSQQVILHKKTLCILFIFCLTIDWMYGIV